MRNAYVYSYTGGALTRALVVVPDLRNLRNILEYANRDGNDETDLRVQQVIADFVNYDPNNDLIHEWYTAAESVQATMEAETPWLAYYRGADWAPAPPAYDPSIKQAQVDAEITAFWRRIAKAKRAEIVREIKVTIGANTFDGDEVAQGRMARAVTIAHAQLLTQLQAYLAGQINNPEITAYQLLTGMHDTLAATKAALSTQWMMADNTAATVTPDELTAALHQAMLELSANWGFN